jgi:hypothetical protein
MNCVVAPKAGIRWREGSKSPLRCDGTSKSAVSCIETAVAKRLSQTASVTVRLYIWTAFSAVPALFHAFCGLPVRSTSGPPTPMTSAVKLSPSFLSSALSGLFSGRLPGRAHSSMRNEIAWDSRFCGSGQSLQSGLTEESWRDDKPGNFLNSCSVDCPWLCRVQRQCRINY